MVARLGTNHPDVARSYNSIGIVAWERGNLDDALRNLRRAVAIWRDAGQPVLYASGLFNHAMVLHSAGREREARLMLEESLRLRRESFGEGHGIVGDTLRLLGEVDAALGDDNAALQSLRQAASITASGYGAGHSHALRAQVSLAAFQAFRDDPVALARLDRIGGLPETDEEQRKTIWLARAHAARVRCTGPERTLALAAFQALDATVREAQPEGGTIAREVRALQAACVANVPRAQ